MLTNCLSVFDHFVGLALNGLRKKNIFEVSSWADFNVILRNK